MFNEELRNTFYSYQIEHIIALLVIFSISLIIFLNRKFIKERIFNLTRYFLAISILLQEVILNIYRIINNEWSLSTSLPLHLCSFAVIITAVVLINKNQKLFMNTFFIMLIGAIMALLTPAIDGNYGYPHFRFIQFFTSHGLIVINFTYLLFVMDYSKDFKYKHLLNNGFTLLILAVLNLIINIIVNGNYLYLMAKPGEGTAFDLFGEHPWYILNILLFGLPILLHIFYIPFYVLNRGNKHS